MRNDRLLNKTEGLSTRTSPILLPPIFQSKPQYSYTIFFVKIRLLNARFNIYRFNVIHRDYEIKLQCIVILNPRVRIML